MILHSATSDPHACSRAMVQPPPPRNDKRRVAARRPSASFAGRRLASLLVLFLSAGDIALGGKRWVQGPNGPSGSSCATAVCASPPPATEQGRVGHKLAYFPDPLGDVNEVPNPRLVMFGGRLNIGTATYGDTWETRRRGSGTSPAHFSGRCPGISSKRRHFREGLDVGGRARRVLRPGRSSVSLQHNKMASAGYRASSHLAGTRSPP